MKVGKKQKSSQIRIVHTKEKPYLCSVFWNEQVK